MNPALIEVVLAGLSVKPELRDAFIGDLIEERTELASARGERLADRWMRRELIRSVPALARGALQSGGTRLLLTTLGAALAAMALVMGMMSVSVAVLDGMIPPEILQRFVLLVLAIELAYGVMGGYLAARIGGSAPFAAALVFGLLGVAITRVASGAEGGWYPLVLQLLLVPATLGGGWVRAHSVARGAP